MGNKYYSLDRIKKAKATYNVIFGKRSNGKSYAVLEEIIKNYFKTGKHGAIIRRVYEDFRATRGSNVFANHVKNGLVEKYSDGKFTDIVYYNRGWYFAYMGDDDKLVRMETPFCYAFSLNGMEHDKSSSYPNVTIVLFDEFISRYSYLTDEFILFQNTLSTIVRDRTDVVIYMLGNSVNIYCPYFNEMGLKHIKDMHPGDLDIYTYGDNKELTVAVEYCESGIKSKAGSKYFGFDNPKLNMINNGAWELSLYPHTPEKYTPKNILFRCEILFDGDKYSMDIVNTNNNIWVNIHPNTKEIDMKNSFILTDTESPLPNVCSNIYTSTYAWVKKLRPFILNRKIFYSDNMTGCAIENYFSVCKAKKP